MLIETLTSMKSRWKKLYKHTTKINLVAYSGHQSKKYLTLGLIINTAFPSRIINLLSEFKTS